MSCVRASITFHLIASATILFGAQAVAASSSEATRDKPQLLLSDAPAAPTENAEARIALRQHRESVVLNRFTFPGNVLEGVGDIVDHWVVMFCPGWHDKCQGLLPSYELLGVQWENKLNKAIMSSSVRFAKTDCATEKALCVSLGIDDYPSVVHYRQNQRVASWHGGAPGLVRFVKQQLEGQKRRPKQSVDRAKTKQAPVCSEAGIIITDASPRSSSRSPTLRALCHVLILLAVAGSACKLLRSRIAATRNTEISKASSTTRESVRERQLEDVRQQRSQIQQSVGL